MCGPAYFVFTLLGSTEDNLTLVFGELLVAWKTLGCDRSSVYRKMKLSMIVKVKKPRTSFPKMRGRAAEVKNLIAGLAIVWERHMSSTIVHKTILAALKASRDMDMVVSRNSGKYVLPPAEADLLLRYAYIYANGQNAAAQHYNEVGHWLFDITYKSHALLHCAMQARHTNPQLSWCYANEDFMRTAKKLVRACCQSGQSHVAADVAMKRWSDAMHARWGKL